MSQKADKFDLAEIRVYRCEMGDMMYGHLMERWLSVPVLVVAGWVFFHLQ